MQLPISTRPTPAGGRRAAALGLAGALVVVGLLLAPAARGQETIPRGATTTVALPASNVVATCTPPLRFHPNATTWVVSPSTVQIGGAGADMPAPGHQIAVTVPAGHSPYQSIRISWSGNTDCVSYNGGIVLKVSSAPPKGSAPAVAPRAQARRFAARAIPIAKQLAGLRRQIVRSRARPARQRALAARALGIARGIGVRFDLDALSNRRSFARSQRLGTDLRQGQLKQLPGFASSLQNVADYDREIVDITERRAASDPELAARMDHLATLQYGSAYAQLGPDERRVIASQVQSQSGALQNLLGRVRQAAAAATRVIFGRR